MAEINTDRVWFIIRGITHYVSRVYRIIETGENSTEISEEDLYLPRKLKVTIAKYLDLFKDEKFVTAHNHVVDMEDREVHLKTSFRAGLIEVAKDCSHDEFLRECTLYIMSATEMDILGFPEAIDIAMDAIYQACMSTKQYEHLILWESHPGQNSIMKKLNNNTYHDSDEDDLDSQLEVNVEF